MYRCTRCTQASAGWSTRTASGHSEVVSRVLAGFEATPEGMGASQSTVPTRISLPWFLSN
jgi:cytochrome c5